jgi:hypothetical protein
MSNEMAEERKRFATEMSAAKMNYDNERRTIFEEHSR